MTNHIAIEGIIGAGKTTTARLLAAKTGFGFVGEAAETHPFLDAFYTDTSKYALETELCFSLLHYHQLYHREAGAFVSDFCFAKDLVFARMNLRGADLESFESLFTHLSKRLPLADRVFFLRVPIPDCIERIKMRGIPREQSISAPYLLALEDAYMQLSQELGRNVQILEVDSAASADTVVEAVIKCLSAA